MHTIMSQQKTWARRPLFLALIASVVLGYLLDRDLEVKSIAAVENRMRYYTFEYTSVGAVEGDYAFFIPENEWLCCIFGGIGAHS